MARTSCAWLLIGGWDRSEWKGQRDGKDKEDSFVCEGGCEAGAQTGSAKAQGCSVIANEWGRALTGYLEHGHIRNCVLCSWRAAGPLGGDWHFGLMSNLP